MSNTVKDYAKQIKNNYSSIIAKVQKKYDVMSGALDKEYLARNTEIERDNKKAKNSASASHKIDLANSQRALMDKGLAKSGESINTEIRSNLSKNQAYATLDAEAEKSKRENSLALTKSKSELLTKRLAEEAGLEERMSEAVLKQANADRDFAQSEKKFAADEEQRGIENERAERKFASDEEQRGIENERAERKFASDEEQRGIENEMAERKFAAEEEQRDIDNERKNQEKVDISNNSTSQNGSNNKKEDDGTVPSYKADDLVNQIYDVYQGKYFPTYTARDEAIKNAIYEILNDTTLAADYKREVRVYASSLGYI